MTAQQKIIGRFEPIGEEVGPPRRAFDVLTKEPYEFKGRQGFKGVALAGALKGEYSVFPEHWRWVPTECEHDFEGRAPDGGPISMQQPVVYVCTKCGQQEDV